MPAVLKSGSLNLLEPSGPVEACNGIALPFTTLLVIALRPGEFFMRHSVERASLLRVLSSPNRIVILEDRPLSASVYT